MEKGQLIHVLALGYDIKLFSQGKIPTICKQHWNRSVLTGDVLPKAQFIPNIFLSFRSFYFGPFFGEWNNNFVGHTATRLHGYTYNIRFSALNEWNIFHLEKHTDMEADKMSWVRNICENIALCMRKLSSKFFWVCVCLWLCVLPSMLCCYCFTVKLVLPKRCAVM